jgi:hypothetical protein
MDRSRRRRLSFAALAIATATMLAACGDDDTASTTTGRAAGTTTTTSGSSSATSRSSNGTATTTVTSGSGGTVGSKQDYVDAAASSIQFADEKIKGCVAEALVSDDVYAAIQKNKLSVDDFKSGDSIDQLKVGQEEAASVATDMAACGELLPQILSGNEAQLSCATKSMSNEQIAKLLSYSLFGIDLPKDLQTANSAVQACVQGSPAPTAPSTTG